MEEIAEELIRRGLREWGKSARRRPTGLEPRVFEPIATLATLEAIEELFRV